MGADERGDADARLGLTAVTILSETLRDNVPLKVAWMSLRQQDFPFQSPAFGTGAVAFFGMAADGGSIKEIRPKTADSDEAARL